jgi:hypothetical protein
MHETDLLEIKPRFESNRVVPDAAGTVAAYPDAAISPEFLFPGAGNAPENVACEYSCESISHFLARTREEPVERTTKKA